MVLNPDLQRDSLSILPHGLQALIFDMDGVLCDTMPYHLEAWVRYVQQVPQLAGITRDALAKMGGKRNQELLSALLTDPFAEEDLHRWGREKEALYRSLIQDEIQWVPGLVSFLEKSRAFGLKLGIGTSACRENVELLLNHENLGRFFQARVIETDVKLGKPDPQCYLRVAERLAIDPACCLVFEDAIAGVQAARAAGMTCWGVLTLHSAAELRAAGAEHCIRDFTMLDFPQDI
jgi:beta-phosphoglucomutase